MIQFEIHETSRENSSWLFTCRDGRVRDIYDEIYEHLYYGLEQAHEIAEDAASWCEFAAPGEDYDADDFAITVHEI